MAGEDTLKKIKDLVSPSSDAVNMNSGVAQSGLNMDQSVNQVGQGSLTYALNAAVENFDANSVNYQNEPGNELCVTFPDGFLLIGKHFIPEQNKYIFFITNPNTGNSQIGYMENNDCIYKVYTQGECLNFKIDYPIHKVVHKITNCTTEIYWTDGINPRRYLNLVDIPYILSSGSNFCNPKYTNEIDCNQLKLQPDFKVPLLSIVDIREGGNLTAGTYQFAIQYSDPAGNPYTSYYSVTNPTPIADPILTTPNFDYKVGQSIVVQITDLDETGQFQYFNLAVIKTVNDISSVELVGTFFVDEFTQKIIYSGQNVSQIRLTINDIFEKFPYYEIAQDLTSVQDILIWDNLTSIDRINYQEIASQIKLQWETYEIPATEDYSDELNATNLRGYLRDEVYAFEIVFILKNGKQTDGFHIPGREMTPQEKLLPDVPDTNFDFVGEEDSAALGVRYKKYWKVYNTATDLGVASSNPTGPTVGPAQPPVSNAIGNAIPHRYGDFAYWESDLEYPCNNDLWGNLAGQKIRHHKFPDVLVSPIFKSSLFVNAGSLVKENRSVYPIGVRVDIESIKQLIASSSLTSEQKADIVGFKIVRGDRSTNKSIIAKGILRNVGKYEREEQSYYFPNYPYNELTSDPLLLGSAGTFSIQSSPWLMTCITPSNTTGKCEIQYISRFSGTPITISLNPGDVAEECSPSRPTTLDGVAEIGPGNYDVYFVYGDDGCAGHDRWWNTPFTTDNSQSLYLNKFVEGWSFIGFKDKYYATVGVGAGAPGYQNSCSGLLICLPFLPCYCTCESKQGTEQKPNTFQPCGKMTLSTTDVFSGDGVNQSPIRTQGRRSLCDCEGPKPLQPVGGTLDSRLVFNSPETSFGNPFLGTILKLEHVMFGKGEAHFVKVRNHANYKFLTKEAQQDALGASFSMAGILGGGAVFAAYQSYLTIYVNGITRKNYAYSYNSIANYDYWSNIPNGLGIKQRDLEIVQYLIPGVLNVGDDANINNYQRESSVYLKTKTRNVLSVSIPYKEYRICNNVTPAVPPDPDHILQIAFTDENNSPGGDAITPGGTCVTVKATTVPVRVAGPLQIDPATGAVNWTITVVGSGVTPAPPGGISVPPLPFPNQTNSLIDPVTNLPRVSEKSRMVLGEVKGCSTPGKERDISVVSYYASLKNEIPGQWGQMYTYTTIDTGFQTNINYNINQPRVVIFGGDTFISRFAFKTKLPFFIDNRVNAPDDSDIFYDEIGNVAYPKYWHSSSSVLDNYTAPGPNILTNIISYKKTNFDCANKPIPANGSLRTFYDGVFYLFAYGIPNFYCESSYNTDLRQAFNAREGDFWPHVSTGIPDDWVQEANVSINNDNTYYYNRTYSKQNKENFFSHLPPDWEEKLCFTNYPFRAIYSDRQVQNADNRVNNWLYYRAVSFFDFPQNFGKLTSLDGIQNRAVLARFDNKSLLYNTLLTVETSNPQAAYLGNDTLFKSAPPIDFAETDLGYVGSQNKFLLKIPQGQVTIDAKRGQIFLISGNQATDLTAFGSGMNRFFTDHLAFEILRFFPDLEKVVNNERIIIPGVNTDNHFNGIGIHGVYDSKYDRVIITKLDYVPLSKDVKYDYDKKEFYIIANGGLRTVVKLVDPRYFCNKSWTLSFNLNTKTWISFHSYLPNFYMGENNFFYSGLNDCDGFTSTQQSATSCMWRHLKNPEIYNTYYGKTQPYIIEYPFSFKYHDEILQNVKDYTKVYKYLPDEFGVFDDNRKIELDDAWFNKAVLYNNQQSSGTLELVAKPMNNLRDYMKYPIYNTDSKVITYTKSDNFYQYNTFWSLVKDKKELLFTKTCESLSVDKIVNQLNMDYSKRSFKKEPLRAKDLKVRHILDNRSDIHLVSQFIVTPTQISFK